MQVGIFAETGIFHQCSKGICSPWSCRAAMYSCINCSLHNPRGYHLHCECAELSSAPGIEEKFPLWVEDWIKAH